MINIDSISKAYGSQVLFEQASLQINPGEKIGLVGRNGHGKTTLLRMLTGMEEQDSGRIQIPGDYRMGYLTQHISFTEKNVLEEAMTGLPEHEKEHYWKAEKILSGLGFSQDDMKRPTETFSGGYQVRLTLAKVLVSDPDLLILDEPTNYLDIVSIRWISGFLRAWPREILLITHDRGFMDSIVTHIAGIHRNIIRKISGNTEKYYEQVAQDEEIYEKTRLNEEKRRKEMELFITRFRAKARLAGLVQSRVKALAKMENREGLKKIENLEFSFRDLPFGGKKIMGCEDISFSYKSKQKSDSFNKSYPLDTIEDETFSKTNSYQDFEVKPLIQDFNLTVTPEDCIAIIGKNGKGKTTLLKILADRLSPDKGEILYNPGVAKGYFEQTNIESLNPNATVEEEILYSHTDLDRQKARNICGAMMFEGDDALKKISVLSGGEKSRVMLAKLLAEPLNLLMLDEPTNHLDMESCDSLLLALDNFSGAILIVTHNEMLLHSLANRLVVFKNNVISIFEGTYQEFLEKEGWEEEIDKNFEKNNEYRTEKSKADDRIKPLGNKELRRLRSDIIKERSKALKHLEKAVEKDEQLIDEFEKKLEKMNQEMQDASEKMDGQKISEIGIKIAKCQSEIDARFDSLEKNMDELEKKSAFFESRLNELQSI
ncbi:ATP-type transporter, ATP binding protein (ATPase) [Desulfamplus magnetovallimortis]|uniref:ATP-type transporter, ATP binding protein (ATPase) n=1 Tax=Desulfamplus magnetovallimortis TaxID=1246637 RepID=A0A1W1HL94_9BACT|nr:ABC-F family ATP-binding cassette domain-containing protein [Desulfamplus magnetovallimortis]SLM33249.1 ATP-type transporter, ATP binding protein (ATPase) [Desulfamplus magnetovallimortis]